MRCSAVLWMDQVTYIRHSYHTDSGTGAIMPSPPSQWGIAEEH